MVFLEGGLRKLVQQCMGTIGGLSLTAVGV